ncbi:GNAT family N-acetyltransferase [Streptomyces verrucosisporus]|uniref:GNAT family N-acetyltransferase n=1 Tax=Streptomyces verrucosisporus TaxID=1695161 RepID=UPI0019CFE6AB|nr:GNAT family N-acetyltransferase [Streptomyces verrucosisporus]MBN3931210.1 GNAT family N-acetyltransferase [Streptomyces verrucosisporus]
MHDFPSPRPVGPYLVRPATPEDVEGARSVMLDTFYREFGYGYVPAWHADVVDVRGTYLTGPRHLLLVAVHGDAPEGKVVATTGLLSRGPAHPPHPRWIAERYPSGSTAQLVRVYVRPGHRRHGLARTMVEMAADFAAAADYASLYLHTNVDVPGARPFWESVAKEIFDARSTGEHGPGFATVHYEIPLPR